VDLRSYESEVPHKSLLKFLLNVILGVEKYATMYLKLKSSI